MAKAEGYRIAITLWGNFVIPEDITYHEEPPGFENEVLLDCTEEQWGKICQDSEASYPGILKENHRLLSRLLA